MTVSLPEESMVPLALARLTPSAETEPEKLPEKPESVRVKVAVPLAEPTPKALTLTEVEPVKLKFPSEATKPLTLTDRKPRSTVAALLDGSVMRRTPLLRVTLKVAEASW